jgi:protein phosphatase 1 regulatory subunit 42
VQYIPPLVARFNNKRWDKFNSEKVCNISYGRIQGRAALISHFQNSSLMHEDKRCRPVLFVSEGPDAGEPEPFPMGVHVRPRAGASAAGSSGSLAGSSQAGGSTAGAAGGAGAGGLGEHGAGGSSGSLNPGSRNSSSHTLVADGAAAAAAAAAAVGGGSSNAEGSSSEAAHKGPPGL